MNLVNWIWSTLATLKKTCLAGFWKRDKHVFPRHWRSRRKVLYVLDWLSSPELVVWVHLWFNCTANSVLRHLESRIESFNFYFMSDEWKLDNITFAYVIFYPDLNVTLFRFSVLSACFLSVPFDLPTSSWCWTIQKRGEESDCRSKINLECRKLRLNYFMCKLSWKLQAQYRKNIFRFWLARKGSNSYEKWPQKEMGSWRTGGRKPATCLL